MFDSSDNPCPAVDMDKKKRKRKLGKWQIRLEDRFEAMDLLAEGKTISQVVEVMAKKHSDWPIEKVKSVYFPKNYYAISRLEGASREEVEKAKIRLTKRKVEASQKMMLQNQDPSFTEARDKRAKERMFNLWQDADFREAARKRMVAFQKDPEFVKKRQDSQARYWTSEKRDFYRERVLEWRKDEAIREKWATAVAVARHSPEERKASSLRMTNLNQNRDFKQARLRYWDIYRQNKIDMLEKADIHIVSKSQGGYLQIGHILTPSQIAVTHEQEEILQDALVDLEPIEKRVIKLLFFARSEYTTLTVADAARILEISVDEAILVFQRAISRLSQNKRLRELF